MTTKDSTNSAMVFKKGHLTTTKDKKNKQSLITWIKHGEVPHKTKEVLSADLLWQRTRKDQRNILCLGSTKKDQSNSR